MSISRKNHKKWSSLPEEAKKRISRMAWEDRSTFDAIKEQFGLSPNDVERFMRSYLERSDYLRWRKRANTRGHLKHEKIRPEGIERFKCTRQRMDGSTKGWK